jgi:hypothetical protein
MFGIVRLAIAAFLIAFPISEHASLDAAKAKQCAGPNPAWQRSPASVPGLAAVNIVSMKRDGLPLWNDKPISWNELARYFKLVTGVHPITIIIFRPTADAPCNAKIKMRQLMSRLLPCDEGKCGEGPQWDDFTKASGGNI